MAVIHTKSCLVFQLKREVKSACREYGRNHYGSDAHIKILGLGRLRVSYDGPASRSNLIIAYSVFFGE